jgi:DNA polymerase
VAQKCPPPPNFALTAAQSRNSLTTEALSHREFLSFGNKMFQVRKERQDFKKFDMQKRIPLRPLRLCVRKIIPDNVYILCVPRVSGKKEKPMDDIASELAELYTQVSACQKCGLHRSRVKAVPGEGPAQPKIMFIGEGPGFHENQQGRPFVGAAGQFLEELLGLINLKREDVYITNVVKCRPPQNRDPQPDEIEACRAYLDKQIALLQPKIIITLGRYSMARAFPNAKISQIHGQPRTIGGIVYVPMYHPAAALHQPSLRSTVEDDFRHVGEWLAEMEDVPEEDEPPVDPAEQLSLF